jgi:rhodanese-related sulfurtransferase
MKELEKTKRISIAAVLTILVVLIALLSYKRPKHLYTVNTHDTLEKITNYSYFMAQNEIDKGTHFLVDIRNSFEFDKGHLENAINMPSPEILSEDNSEILENLKEENKTIVIYGNNPNQAIAPYMLLSQLGFDNLKILMVENSYSQNKLITKNVTIENSTADVTAFIKESIQKTEEAMKKANIVVKQKAITPPKKIIPVKKKKKMPAEGGC